MLCARTRYRIVTDCYNGFEVQAWRWWWPFWMQFEINTNPSPGAAKVWLAGRLIRRLEIKPTVVEYFDVTTSKKRTLGSAESSLRFGTENMKPTPIAVRQRDHALFECDSTSTHPLRMARVEWVPYRFWFGGRLVRTGAYWIPYCDSEFEWVNRKLVTAGCRELARREKAA